MKFRKKIIPFRHCLCCGAADFAADTFKSFQCAACGFKFFFNPAPATIAIISDETSRLLVTTRKSEPAKGTLDLPGGFCDPGETAEECLNREIREELNINIRHSTYIGSEPNIYAFEGVVYKTLDLVFLCRVESFTGIIARDDVASIHFMKKSELDPEKFGLLSNKNIIGKIIACEGNFAVL